MSEAPATPAVPDKARALLADKLADFSDKPSPMLVKELRQGLRAKTFVIVFLTLQGLLGLVLLSSLGAASSPQDAGHNISGIIFMFFALAVLVIQPARAIGALHREVQENTIELMVLTRLSAWKIVLGKWISLVAQSALLLAAVIPYLILRYWFGDMNLFGELILLLLVFLTSAFATAVVIGVSCLPSVIIRGLLPLIFGAIGVVAIPGFCFDGNFDELVETCSMQSPKDFMSVLAFVFSGCYIGWTALGIGASQIAPVAENHSSPKRLACLVLLSLILIISLFTQPGVYYLLALVMILAIPALVMALTEPINLLPPVCAPFLKKGTAGIIAGRFLYPGWPSGVMFSALLIAFSSGILVFGGDTSLTLDDLTRLTGMLGSLLMPAAIMSFFDKKIANRFTFYLLILVSQFVLTLVLHYIADALSDEQRGFLWFFCWIPMNFFSMIEMPRTFDPKSIFQVALGISLFYGIVLLINAVIRLRSIRDVEMEYLEHLKT
ncbi:hypothetical protein ACFQY0_03865 [Haloferula chungangensis]|uniref:ABC-2 family transporter protein n=1 Tax=Haloferula chungangensis TaxID=1048331 RepID=A0ABW2L492_9BACT